MQAKYGAQVVGLDWVEGLDTWSLKFKDGENLGNFTAVVVADKGAAKLLLGKWLSIPYAVCVHHIEWDSTSLIFSGQ